MSRIGIDPATSADPYALLPLAQYVDHFERAAQVLGNQSLGLLVGMRMRPADLGPAGVLLSISPTIQSGLARIANDTSILQEGTHSSLFEVGGDLVWTYRLSDSTIWPRRQDAEFSLATVCQLIRQSFSPNWQPLEVHLEHGEHSDPHLLQKLFRAPVLFHQSANRLILSRDEAIRRHRTEDSGMIGILERHIADLSQQHQPQATVVDRVRRVISVTLGQRPVTLTSVAANLRMSARSLQRYLAEEGTSIRALVQEHRADLARTLLEKTDMPLSQVALTLGYADGTVFWRAYRSWTGQEPSACRRPSAP
ncbi:AraC family transcriptional regulator [Pseudotabrizicola alkalilacus]|uniref:AraC family transcriptional regulator n=1 Tax=Pseudotabrizicola alkalilacus TaxID=2305252 RepID=A0A411Z3G4_9RHOB|nr:AraC family transcriptional regulator [Pseudotabrizicola alkalilacus]RGP37603.1 AraC family transcriptional regulator [Pseudotabrizicola alkalilacus]